MVITVIMAGMLNLAQNPSLFQANVGKAKLPASENNRRTMPTGICLSAAPFVISRKF